MASTEDPVYLSDAVDKYGRSVYTPPDPSNGVGNLDLHVNVDIAPWQDANDVPPTPPPKSGKSKFGFNHKPSLSSFAHKVPDKQSLRAQPSLVSVVPSVHSSRQLYSQAGSGASLSLLSFGSYGNNGASSTRLPASSPTASISTQRPYSPDEPRFNVEVDITDRRATSPSKAIKRSKSPMGRKPSFLGLAFMRKRSIPKLRPDSPEDSPPPLPPIVVPPVQENYRLAGSAPSLAIHIEDPVSSPDSESLPSASVTTDAKKKLPFHKRIVVPLGSSKALTMSNSSLHSPKRRYFRHHKETQVRNTAPTVPENDTQSLMLDTNISEMDGIIDLTRTAVVDISRPRVAAVRGSIDSSDNGSLDDSRTHRRSHSNTRRQGVMPLVQGDYRDIPLSNTSLSRDSHSTTGLTTLVSLTSTPSQKTSLSHDASLSSHDRASDPSGGTNSSPLVTSFGPDIMGDAVAADASQSVNEDWRPPESWAVQPQEGVQDEQYSSAEEEHDDDHGYDGRDEDWAKDGGATITTFHEDSISLDEPSRSISSVLPPRKRKKRKTFSTASSSQFSSPSGHLSSSTSYSMSTHHSMASSSTIISPASLSAHGPALSSGHIEHSMSLYDRSHKLSGASVSFPLVSAHGDGEMRGGQSSASLFSKTSSTSGTRGTQSFLDIRRPSLDAPSVQASASVVTHSSWDSSMNEPPITRSYHDSAHQAASKDGMRTREKSGKSSAKSAKSRSLRNQLWRVRVYGDGKQHRVASLPYHTTVGDLIKVIADIQMQEIAKQSVKTQSPKQYRLHLKERGRERLLAQNERPADIIRRRLIQAGYDESDSLNYYGGEDMTFIYKFVYKSQALGSTEEDNPLKLDGFELVDVSANGLLTIPVILHKHADSIVVLKLSRNPIVDIPTDFIQSCIQLKQLFLCQMAMKKVPHSIRESKTLQLLDLSFNRIVELEDAYLDQIPGLVTLRVQNNRLESIPWYFPRLRHLANLNISNNKLRTFPRVIAQLEALEDLDVSFNMITELPEELGKLEHLKRLNILANQIGRFPDDCASMHALEILDCRRNAITDLSVISGLPMLRQLLSDHNAIHALDLELAPELVVLDVSSNDITRFSIRPSSLSQTQICALTSLDMSHAKLSSIPPETLGHLLSLNTLILNYNTFRELPDSLGDLEFLEFLSIANNSLVALPKTIGSLQRLTKLDVHSNSLREFPIEIWRCSRLKILNATSNLLSIWHSPPAPPPRKDSRGGIDAGSERKGSGLGELASSVDSSSGSLPPLSQSLQRLYLGENRLTDESLLPLTLLYSLEVLNLSFNDITDLPSSFFKSFTQLQAVYLSGNKLTSLPTEDMPRLSKLTTLFLNGNRMTTLPADLAKVQTLMSLDVGSNNLKYNINNWEFDWNWNFNPKLKYLNLSGNTKLQIKSDVTTFSPNHRFSRVERSRKALSGFTDLNQLRVLGLMDVTIITTGDNASIDIPDENEDRRVRTSLSTVNGMSYGISDTLGKNDELNMIDLVHEFRAGGGAVFAMFGRAEPPKGVPPGGSTNRLAKVLHDEFIRAFDTHLGTLNPERGDTVPDALRRTFLWLNKYVHDRMFGSAKRITPPVDPGFARSGASGIVLYFKDTMLYVANCGNALAVICKNGTAHALSTKHDPWDPGETQRIRAADGWISPQGLVNDEIDLSRSFGFYHLLPVVNARPDINAWELSELDEFVIVGNRGLWDYVSYQTAVDIARSEGENTMVAAQKLRDIAISYGAEGSTMIMVIRVSDLFRKTRPIQPPPESVVDTHAQQVFGAINDIRAKKNQITDRNIARLAREVAPPTGNITIVFTDIRNSTHLWEANPGMNTAMRLHNNLLRRQLRFCRGYEVKTEGDAFMCSFPSAMSALWWCLTVQLQLLQEEWPLEILECEDGKPIYDSENRLIARGLSVRMGIHCGAPLCERDPLTDRMDYFGPMVNRAARICGSAGGGQIMCSADIVREINARIFETEPPTLDSNEIQFQHDSHPGQAIPSVKRIGITVIPVGEVKLKGLELPEVLSLVFPKDLEARQDLKEDKEDPKASGSRIQFSVSQMRQLGILCLRLEAIASSRVFCFTSERKESVQTSQSKDTTDREQEPPESVRFYGDPDVLLPPITEKSSDFELMMVLDSFSVRIENALSTIDRRLRPKHRPPDIVPPPPQIGPLLSTSLLPTQSPWSPLPPFPTTPFPFPSAPVTPVSSNPLIGVDPTAAWAVALSALDERTLQNVLSALQSPSS